MYIFIFILLIIILLIILTSQNNLDNFGNQYNINHIVDKIYIINMDKDKERLKNLDKKMKSLNLNYKRISGIDGEKVYPEYKNITKLRPGQLGCLLSHKEVLEDAIKNNYENILVLEDDIIFHKNFHSEFEKKYKYLLEKEKRFDLIYLGCSQSLGGLGQWKHTKMKNHYYDNYSTDGTFSMLINKNIFNVILNYINKLDIPIDTSISKNILKKKKYKCFTIYPHIITSNVSLLSNTDNLERDNNSYFNSNRIDINNFDI